MSENLTQKLLSYIDKMSDRQKRNLLVEFEGTFKIENRKEPRKQHLMQIDYASKDQFHNDFIDNISSPGLFIQTKSKFRVGDELMLSLSLPDNRGNIKLKGEVVRVANDGIGVEYKISPYLKSHIVRKLKID